ncbi:DNA helicase-2/ATP-dependent DNA helicase PcrA [Variovorax paradoxus]|uniref:ATP-dependent helicase n=1 Tax=Variovorax paradoxus TaxID=34073 RepID=UPI0033989A0A
MDTSNRPPASVTALFVPQTLSPTQEQHAIQTAADRTIIVEANAGAAKTTTLALRMAEAWKRGTSPEFFTALTYTQTACDALRAALRKIGIPHAVISRFRIQTFEGFCEEVLDEMLDATVPRLHHAEELRPFVWEAVRRVEENESERWRSDLLMPSLGDNGLVEEFLDLNALLKGSMRDLLERGDSAASPDYAAAIGVEYTQLKIFLAYEKIRRRENADKPRFRGPSDATYDLARLLCEDESIEGLKAWPFSTKVLMVDEMHDLNHAMFRVLQKLLNTTPSLFCGVGDLDQVIHQSAGADARFMGDAIETVTRRRVRRYPLTHSYRFSRALALKAGRIAEKPYSSMAEHETKISLAGYESPEDCARMVAEEAGRWQARPRAKMNEFAILLRHSYQSVHVENALLARDISYTTSGLESYLLRPEVLFIRGVLAVATDSLGSVADDLTREKVMQALFFFSGSRIEVKGREHETQEALLADAVRSVKDAPGFLTHFFDNQILRNAEPSMKRRLERAVKLAREQTGPQLLTELLGVLKVESIVNEVYVSRQRRRDALGNLEGLQLAAAQFDTASEYFQSLNDAEQKQRQLKKSDSLVIASITNVKGLEFDHVVLPYLAQGEFPASSAADSDERNMFYVGITRARRFLTMLARADAPSSLVQKMGYKPATASRLPEPSA